MVIRVSTTGSVVREVEFISRPRLVQGRVDPGLFAKFSILCDGVYFQVYASNPEDISWLRINDVRAGSSVVVLGRMAIRTYLNRRGERATSYSLTLERIALAVTAEIIIGSTLATERRPMQNVTAESIVQELQRVGKLSMSVTDNFAKDMKDSSDEELLAIFTERFVSNFPWAAVNISEDDCKALAVGMPGTMRRELLFGGLGNINYDSFREYVKGAVNGAEVGRLSNGSIAAFMKSMNIPVPGATGGSAMEM